MGELFHVEQFGANGNGFGEGGCKSLILLRILLRKIMAICAFLQRMGSFDVERRKLLSNSVGKEGFLRGKWLCTGNIMRQILYIDRRTGYIARRIGYILWRIGYSGCRDSIVGEDKYEGGPPACSP